MTDTLDIPGLRANLAAATKGPLISELHEKSGTISVLARRGDGDNRPSDGYGSVFTVECKPSRWSDYAEYPPLVPEIVALVNCIVAVHNAGPALFDAAEERDALRAAVARLREALTAVDGIAWSVPFIESTESEALNKRLFDIRALTKAALAPEPTP